MTGFSFVGAEAVHLFFEERLLHLHTATETPAVCRDFEHEVGFLDRDWNVRGEDCCSEGVERFLAFAFHYDDFGAESVRLGVAGGSRFSFVITGPFERGPLVRAASVRVIYSRVLLARLYTVGVRVSGASKKLALNLNEIRSEKSFTAVAEVAKLGFGGVFTGCRKPNYGELPVIGYALFSPFASESQDFYCR